jgi:hypothetical protein
MSRDGSAMGGLLAYLHADGCSEDHEQMTCHPVFVPDGRERAYKYSERCGSIEVVVMAWCPECGAADWGEV